MKPIGFYVSVPEGHEDYEHLKALEEKYGSYFEKVDKYNLWEMLLYSVHKPMPYLATEVDYPLLVNLKPTTLFDLIPFLHQVIKERLVKDATN
jgi:hypothetical protein